MGAHIRGVTVLSASHHQAEQSALTPRDVCLCMGYMKRMLRPVLRLLCCAFRTQKPRRTCGGGLVVAYELRRAIQPTEQ